MKTFWDFMCEAIKTAVGDDAKDLTWQAEWPETMPCSKDGCDGVAEIAVAYQEKGKGDNVCDMHKNEPDGDGYWPHDCVAIANYLCRKCFTVTSDINQG